MSYLIDTNIIIYRLKNRGMVNEHFEKHRDEDMYISSIVYGELVYGAKKSMFVEKNLATANLVKTIFHVIDTSTEIMAIFGEIKAYSEKIGKPTADLDLIIAATALENDLTLVTHNTKHFNHIPHLELEDWF